MRPGVGWDVFVDTTTGSLEDQGWHLLTMTFDDANNQFRLYVDDTQVVSETDSHSIQYTGLGSHTVIGRHGNGSGVYDLTGDVDDVRVYDSAMTDEQIADL